LYPYINKYGEYPVGHPEEITVLDDISKMLGRPGLGVWTVDVKCPQKLYHPLLHEKKDGKLMFDLTPKTNQMYTNLELQKAVALGYTITKVYHVFHWEKTMTGIFSEYINTFLALKQQAAGWPTDCKTDEEKEKYIQEYLAFEHVKLDKLLISDKPNSGLYAIAKIFLNSLWGKFGQRLNEEYTSTQVINANVEGNKKWHEERQKSTIRDFVPLNTDSALLVTAKKAQTGVVSDKNVVLAIFTTAQARLKLYIDLLEPLGESVLYYDTDSCIYIGGEVEVALGKFLGQLTSEIGNDKYSLAGGFITEFFSGGPKNYGYKTFDEGDIKYQFKCKGLNTSRTDIHTQLNYDVAKEIVLGNSSSVTVGFEAIRRHGRFEVDTRSITKQYRQNFTKRKALTPTVFDGEVVMIDTYPWTTGDASEYENKIGALAKKRPREEEESPKKRKFAKRDGGANFTVYMLQSGEETYVGSTHDLDKRLKQHNGEVTGGGNIAPTEHRPWKVRSTITGYQTRCEALGYEKKVHDCKPGLVGCERFRQATDRLERADIKFAWHLNDKLTLINFQ
jgi:predicted GIY-YIG superfamily endonuclease